MTNTQPRSLRLDDWPAADRAAWQAACRPGERLRRGGSASHMRAVTQRDLANRYGLFLDFVQRAGRLDQSAEAGAHVTPERIDDYVAELQARVRSVTVYGSVFKLRRATQIIAPHQDVTWLRELEKDLALVMQPQSKMNRLILAEVLVEAGITLMIEADAAQHLTPLARATQYRNGLMIALLACCPIRLKNFAALAIGSTLVKVEGTWWIILSAEQTKEKRPDERPIPNILTSYINRYVDHHRSVFDRSGRSADALWVSSRTARPMSYLGIEATITRTAALTTGIAVSPHLFRTSAATTAAIHAGKTPHLASALLDHRDTVTTQRHYNRATSLTAGKAYLNVIRSEYG